MTGCTHCGKVLHGEIHAVNGLLFCTANCAIEYLANEVRATADQLAAEVYNDNVEIITAEDIGEEPGSMWFLEQYIMRQCRCSAEEADEKLYRVMDALDRMLEEDDDECD